MTNEEAQIIIGNIPVYSDENYSIAEYQEAKTMAIKALSVPEREKGEWIEKEGYDGDTYYDCSVCGNSWTTIEGTPWDNGMDFCPNCGADMRGGKE